MTSFISFADISDHATPHRRARPGQWATTSRPEAPHSATTSPSCADVAFRPTTRSHDRRRTVVARDWAHSVWEASGDRGDSLGSRHGGWSRGSGEKSLVEASRERGSNPARRRVLHPGRVEGRSPAALVVAGKLEVVALVRHTDGDPPDAGPGVEPGAEGVEGARGRRIRDARVGCTVQRQPPARTARLRAARRV
jgi:hypothetical protein